MSGSLDQLHDITTPAPPPWWPPQLGWWILVAITLAIATYYTRRWLRRHRAEAWRRSALATIGKWQDAVAIGNQPPLQRELPELLRRCAIVAYGREEGIRLQPESASGQRLIELAYQPVDSLPDPAKTLHEARNWIQSLERRTPC